METTIVGYIGVMGSRTNPAPTSEVAAAGDMMGEGLAEGRVGSSVFRSLT